jgi:hypothetical protein
MFTSTNTYTINETFVSTQSFSETLPNSCYAGSGAAQCSDLGGTTSLGTVTVTATCTGTFTTSCTCTVSLTGTSNQSGSFTTQGNNLVLTPTGQAATTFGYCVKGTQLDLNASLSGTANSNTYIAFLKN